MARNYKPFPELWWLRRRLKLSSKTPSGLEWCLAHRHRKVGDPAGTYDHATGFYKVCVNGERYLAHRLVWYLQTGKEPTGGDVIHAESNPGKDNRLELALSTAYQKKRTAGPTSYNYCPKSELF